MFGTWGIWEKTSVSTTIDVTCLGPLKSHALLDLKRYFSGYECTLVHGKKTAEKIQSAKRRSFLPKDPVERSFGGSFGRRKIFLRLFGIFSASENIFGNLFIVFRAIVLQSAVLQL